MRPGPFLAALTALLGLTFGPAWAQPASRPTARPPVVRAIEDSVRTNIETAVRRVKLKLQVERSAGPVTAMDMTADGRYLVAASADRSLRLWDLAGGRQVEKMSANGRRMARLEFLPGSRRFVGLAEEGSLAWWEVGGPKNQALPAPGGAPVATFAASPTAGLLGTGGRDGLVGVVFLEGGKTEARVIGRHGAAVRALDVGATGRHVVTAGEDGSIKVWEIESGIVVASWQASRVPVTAVRFGRDETELFSGDAAGKVEFWTVDRKTPVQSFPGAEKAITALVPAAGNAALAAAEEGGRILRWEAAVPDRPAAIEAHAGTIRALRFDTDMRTVLSTGDDGLIRFWNVADGTAALTLASTTDGWAAVDDKGRFDGSDGALRDVRWAGETLVLPVENFSEKFYEPGVLAKRRRAGAVFVTAPDFAIGDGILPPPLTRIEAPDSLTQERRDPVEVRVEAINQGGGIETVRLFHNGKVIDPENVVRRDLRQDREGRTETVQLTYRVVATTGTNYLSADAASTENVIGPAAERQVRVSTPQERPTLHIVLIGINSYREPELALNYARTDAEGLLAALQRSYQPLFGGFKTHQVYDAEATAEGILAVLDALRATPPEDVVVVYYAGHGEATGDEFYLIPYDFRRPFSEASLVRFGIPSGTLREKITRIGARRVLMLVDACKSGTAVEILQDFVDRRALRRLGSAVGVYVVAATAKSQYAVELHKLRHGVFTYALLAALEGEADRNPKDGFVTVREMIAFAEEEVPAISDVFADHQQWPLVFSRGLDFAIRPVEPSADRTGEASGVSRRLP